MSSKGNVGFIKGVFAAPGAIAALVAIYELFIKPQSLQTIPSTPTAVLPPIIQSTVPTQKPPPSSYLCLREKV